MAAAAVPHGLLLPRPPGGMVRGAALALTAHGALLLALTTVTQWRTSTPEAVSAELWASVPQVAAPRAPAPAPAPAPPAPVPAPPPAPPVQKVEPALPDPQIVTARQKAEREKTQREKTEREEKLAQERERKNREQAERDKKAAEEKRLAETRQKNLDRMMGQVGTSATGSGTAAQDAGPSKSYAGKLVATIKPNIVFTDTLSGNPAAEVEVRAGPSGTIIARRLVRSSGHKDWDDAVLRAIDRTATLPRDTDGRVPSTIIVAFRPQE